MIRPLAATVSVVALAGVIPIAAGGCEKAEMGKKAWAAPETSPVAAPVPEGRPSDERVSALLRQFRWDEFEQMVYVLSLADREPAPVDSGDPPEMSPQEKAFRANMAERQEKLEAHRASDLVQKVNEGREKIRAARRAGDDQKARQLEQEYAAATDEAFARMEELRRIVMGPLTAPQRKHWAQYVVYREAWRRFGNAGMNDEQKDALWRRAEQAARQLVDAHYVHTDPYLCSAGPKAQWNAAYRPVLGHAYHHILTDDQREEVEEPEGG